MSMIPHLHQQGKMNLGICKHVLVLLDRERPLQLRLRSFWLFVTDFVKIYTNLYPFWWVLLVFKLHFVIFSLTWLFIGLFYINHRYKKENRENPLKIPLKAKIFTDLPKKRNRGDSFFLNFSNIFYQRKNFSESKKCYIYNIMSYSTFRKQKSQQIPLYN